VTPGEARAWAHEYYPAIPEDEAVTLLVQMAHGETEQERTRAMVTLLGRDVDHGRNGHQAATPLKEAAAGPHLFAPLTVAQLYDSTSDAIEWRWQDFLPVGALVLLAAFMKAGKTTLAYALISAILRGETFLGRPTTPCKVLLLALEEHRRDVKRRLLKFGIGRDAALSIQFRAVPTTPHEWAALATFVKEQGIGLLVIDTLARCWPVWGVDNENDNARVAAALSPLLELCREHNVTALLLHHTGKLAEGFGREVRGAGAILALADQALLFDRYRSGDPCDRIIRTLGRYDESPAETIIRYDKAAGTYTLVEEEARDEQARGAERLFPSMLTYLRTRKETGASMRDLRGNVQGRNATKDQAIGLLVDTDKVVLKDGRYYHSDYDPRGVQ
jgi:hypothetical protein